MTARESEVEAYFVERVKALGGYTRKVKWLGRNKAPDRRAGLPATGCNHRFVGYVGRPARAFWVEFKAEGLAATFPNDAHERAQHREHQRMRACGEVVYVIDSKAGVDEVLR